jgi:predicted HTH domain antitoxin
MYFNHDLFIAKFQEQNVSIRFLSEVSRINLSTIWKLLHRENINIQIDSLRRLEKTLLIEKGGLLL